MKPILISPGGMKTGQSSLRYACKVLGMECLGYVHGNTSDIDLIVSAVAGWDALFDLPAAAMWAPIVARYPHTKVVMTVRDMDEWLASIEDWIAHRPFKTPAERELARRVLGDYVYRKHLFRVKKQQHDAAIFEWGEQNHDRYLLLDILGGEGWEELCPFLGVDVPDVPFPHVRPGAPVDTWVTAGVTPNGSGGDTWK